VSTREDNKHRRAGKQAIEEQLLSLYYSLDSVVSVNGEIGGTWGKL
jgi:hypothetical protein